MRLELIDVAILESLCKFCDIEAVQLSLLYGIQRREKHREWGNMSLVQLEKLNL